MPFVINRIHFFDQIYFVETKLFNWRSIQFIRNFLFIIYNFFFTNRIRNYAEKFTTWSII